MFRRRRNDAKPDPAVVALAPRWRAPVERAQQARARFDAVAARAKPGPVADQLGALAARLDIAVHSALDIAQRAHETEATLRTLSLDEVSDRLKGARRRLAQLPDAAPERARAEQEVAMLAEQFASLNRLHNGLDEAAQRLDELELRMETAVTRATELALSPGSPITDTGIDDVVDQLAALQGALDDLRD